MTREQVKTLATADATIANASRELDEMRRIVREAESLLEGLIAARRFYVAHISRDGLWLQ